jgi:hypothetical protein
MNKIRVKIVSLKVVFMYHKERLWIDVVIVSVFQFQFVWNVSHWNAMKPAFYHGHLAFVDFAP